jgi:hypothetical protein
MTGFHDFGYRNGFGEQWNWFMNTIFALGFFYAICVALRADPQGVAELSQAIDKIAKERGMFITGRRRLKFHSKQPPAGPQPNPTVEFKNGEDIGRREDIR